MKRREFLTGLAALPLFPVVADEVLPVVDPPGGLTAQDVVAWQELPWQERRFVTGFPTLDEALGGGMRAGELMLVYGEPGAGKSAMLETIAMYSGNIPANRVDLEYSDDYLVLGGDWTYTYFRDTNLFVKGHTSDDRCNMARGYRKQATDKNAAVILGICSRGKLPNGSCESIQHAVMWVGDYAYLSEPVRPADYALMLRKTDTPGISKAYLFKNRNGGKASFLITVGVSSREPLRTNAFEISGSGIV